MHCVPHVVCCAGNTQYEVLQSSSDSLQIGQVPQRGMDHWGESTRSYSGSGYTLLSLFCRTREPVLFPSYYQLPLMSVKV